MPPKSTWTPHHASVDARSVGDLDFVYAVSPDAGRVAVPSGLTLREMRIGGTGQLPNLTHRALPSVALKSLVSITCQHLFLSGKTQSISTADTASSPWAFPL